MQKITVKEIRGPLGRGEKKFYAVVDDKGAEFTTFDTKIAQVTPGSVLEVELKVEGKYVNITEWKVIEEGKPSVSPGNGRTSYGKTPEQFDAERRSIEAQVAFKGIIELSVKGKVWPAELEERLIKISNLALDWAEVRLKGTIPSTATGVTEKPKEQPVDKKVSPPSASTQEAIDNGHFENVGQFLTACNKKFGMSRSQVLKESNATDPSEIKDLDATWQQIYAVRK